MSGNSVIALTLAILVMISFWRQLLILIMALLMAIFVLGLYQIIHLLHR